MYRLQSALRPTLAIALGLIVSGPVAAHGQVGRSPSTSQRVILVTGSTSGLGLEVAQALAANGDHVIVHGRSAERGLALVEEINGGSTGSARFYEADFASLEEVRRLAEAITRDYERLDVLVNNAGILFADNPERQLSMEGHELTFQVNYLAPYLLTDLLLPLLRRSAPARIVNVASTAADRLDFDDLMLTEGYTGWGAYNQSKLAQVMHTIDLAAELDGTGITVNALHPATLMDTNMVIGNRIAPRSSVTEGRDRVLELINADSLGSGEFYVDGRPAQARDPQAYDADARSRLRSVSEELIRR